MTKQIALFSALAASLVASLAVHAADTTELKVKGVIRPSACTPSFTGGGVADYGTIPAKSLAAGTYTRLAEKSVPFTITCDGPAKMALKVSDNRATSTMPETTGTESVPGIAFGLGTVNGVKIGSYTLQLRQSSVTTDGVAATQIFSQDGNKTWVATGVNGSLGTDRTFSWANSGTTVPAAYKTVSGQVSINVGLNKPESLPMTQEIPLDGSATLEVVYL